MRILWICPYLPWPTTGGNRVRIYHLLRALAMRGHRITLLARSSIEPDESSRSALQPFLERLVVVVHRRRHRYHPLSIAIAAFAPYPMLVSVFGFSKRSSAALDELLEQPWDIVQVEHSYGMQPFLPPLLRHRRPFVLTEHNVESSLVYLNRYNRWFPLPLVHALRRYDVWRFRRWERRTMRAARRVVAVTSQDARRLAQISGREVDVVANGADVDGFATVHPGVDHQRMMFIANFDYPPNVDALHWAAKEILPLVWRQVPAARLVVCGNGMRDDWRRQWQHERIDWLGYVDDLASVQRQCTLFIAPLKSGGGSKLKVLEAMAAGLAIVSTSEGVSGLDVRNGQDVLLGENSEDFADRVIRLLQDPDLAREIGEAGRRYVARRHAWPQLAVQMEMIYSALSS